MTEKVVWSHAEFVTLGKAWLAMRKENPVSTVRSTVIFAQDHLPEDRRRAVGNYVTSGKWIEAFIQAHPEEFAPAAKVQESKPVLDLSNLAMTAAEPSVPVSLNAPALDFSHIEAAVNQAIAPIVDKEMERYVLEYRSFVQGRIRAEVALRMESLNQVQGMDIEAEVKRELASQFDASKKKFGDQVKAEVVRKRVVVVGLKGSQITEVKALMGDSFKLTFVGSDEPVQQLRATCKHADHVLMMRKFISHKFTNAINKQTHHGFVMIDGGISELENALVELV